MAVQQPMQKIVLVTILFWVNKTKGLHLKSGILDCEVKDWVRVYLLLSQTVFEAQLVACNSSVSVCTNDAQPMACKLRSAPRVTGSGLQQAWSAASSSPSASCSLPCTVTLNLSVARGKLSSSFHPLCFYSPTRGEWSPIVHPGLKHPVHCSKRLNFTGLMLYPSRCQEDDLIPYDSGTQF